MKKFLIGLGVFCALIVAAVLVVPSFIDWSGYRVEIAQKVKQATGRELLIGGDIAFTLVPAPVLRMNDIHLSNATGASDRDMVSIRQLDVRVALFPLLKGTVHVQSLRLIEPVISLEVLESGQGNWVLSPEGAPVNEEEPQQQAGEPVFEEETSTEDDSLPVQIDDFIIEKGRIVFADKANGTFEEVHDLNSRFAVAGLRGPFEAAGTVVVRDIPVGFEGSVGQIVHGRTASFASEIKFAHGETAAKISGTFINLPEGPRLKSKVDVKGQSLAGFISAFEREGDLPGALDRSFSLDGEISYGSSGLSFGKDGLGLSLGEDKGNLALSYVQAPEGKTIETQVSFSKINGDAWLDAKPYVRKEPEALPLVIELSKSVSGSAGGRVSAALSKPAAKKEAQLAAAQQKAVVLPKDITAKVSLNVDAVMIKGEPVRQLQASLSMQDGEVALERLSAILPGASEFSMVGVAGERDGQIQFDGSLDFNMAHLRGGLRWFDIDVSHVPTERLQQINLKSEVSLTQDEARLYDFVAKLDQSTLSGAATIALRKRPSFGANFVLDRLNVDAYLAGGKTQSPVTQKPMSTTTRKTSDKASPAPGAQTSSPLDALAVLDAFDANLVFSLGHLIYQKRDVQDISLDATIFDGGLSLRTFGVKNLAGLSLNGNGAVKRSDKGVLAENLSLSLQGKNLSGAAAVAGLDQVMDWAAFGPVSVKATLNGNVLAPDLDVTADVVGGTAIVSGSGDLFPMPKFEASLNLQHANLQEATRRLGLSYRPSGNPGPLDLNADVAYTAAGVSVKNLTGNIAQTTLSGEINLKQGQRPFLDVALQTGALRLDPFMPSEGGGQKKTGKKSQAKPSTTSGQTTSSSQGTSSGKWSKDKIDLSALTTMDGKIRIQSSALSHKKITARNVVVNADLKDGVLDLSKVSAGLFGGQAELSSLIKAGNVADISTNFQLNGLSVASLLSQTDSDTKAKGGLNLSGQLTTAGQSEADFVSNLNGGAELALQKLAMDGKSGGNQAFALINFLSSLSGKDPSKGLADVMVKTDIRQGVATLSSASLVSAIANGTAGGTLDLPNWLIDVSGRLNMQQNALLGLLAQKAKMKSEYPFSFKGALDKPNVKLDTGGLSSGGGLVIPLSDHAEKKGYGNLIRGLLGAGGIKVAPGQKEESASTPTPLPPASGSDGTGTMAPPPPPPGGSSSSSSQQKAPSVEQQLLQGLGTLLKNR